MASETGIEWTDATWNPWMGCHKVSQGCAHCYMYREARQYGREPDLVQRSRTTFDAPLRWARLPADRRPRRVFTCSWSDFFHPHADAWRPAAWDIIRRTPDITYLILTKRPQLAADRLPADWGQGWPHVWIGVSIEDQHTARARLPQLLAIPAHRRFLSVEPLLAPVDLVEAAPVPTADDLDAWRYVDARDTSTRPSDLTEPGEDWSNMGRGVSENPALRLWQQLRNRQAQAYVLSRDVHWIIVGGESGGADARPLHPDWVRLVREFCLGWDVPFFFKQWGHYLPVEADPNAAQDGRGVSVRYEPVGRTRAGAVLDGQEWRQMPSEWLTDGHSEAGGVRHTFAYEGSVGTSPAAADL